MFGGNSSWPFQDDPFFRAHNESMQRMMGSFPDPFGRNAIQQGTDQRNAAPRNDVMAPMDMFSNNFMFGGSMFQNMQQQMNAMANDTNNHSYSSSTVMSFSSNGNEPPKYYHATTSTKNAPGGVRETRKTVRDSQTGVHKMAIEQRLGDRGHRYERAKNIHRGDVEEEREFYNMDEEDAPEFDREWRQRTHRHRNAVDYNNRRHHRPHHGMLTHRDNRS